MSVTLVVFALVGLPVTQSVVHIPPRMVTVRDRGSNSRFLIDVGFC